jgi:hypothetical protein
VGGAVTMQVATETAVLVAHIVHILVRCYFLALRSAYLSSIRATDDTGNLESADIRRH